MFVITPQSVKTGIRFLSDLIFDFNQIIFLCLDVIDEELGITKIKLKGISYSKYRETAYVLKDRQQSMRAVFVFP